MSKLRPGNRPDKGRESDADEIESDIAELLDLEEGREKVRAPAGFGDFVANVKFEVQDAHFQRETLDPLRRKALACVRRLERILRQIVDAERQLPRRRRAERAASLAKAYDKAKEFESTSASTAADRHATIRPPSSLGKPEFTLWALPALIAYLNSPLAHSGRGAGRPRSVARIVQDEAKKAGLGDRRTGQLLKLEGLERAADPDTLKERVRGRRRARGEKSPTRK